MTRGIGRRRFLRTGTGAVVVGTLAGCSNGNETVEVDATSGTGEPDVPKKIDDHLTNANGYDGTILDATDESSVTIAVGTGDAGTAYDPVAIRISTKTAINWKWTGKGGKHDIQATDDSLWAISNEKGLTGQAGNVYSFTPSQSVGVINYYCSNHQDSGMKGGIDIVP